jgi:hypothetical protein
MKRFSVGMILVVLLGLMSGVTVAAAQSSDCLECHDVSAPGGSSLKVDFGVADVDYTKCNTCHWLDGTMGDHWHQPEPCRTCHYSWTPYDAPYFSPVYDAGDYGFFAGPDSVATPADELHQIHTAGSWVDGFCDPTMGCENCHAPSACSACHGSDVAHGPHAESEYPAVDYRAASGTSVDIISITCVNDACHPTPAVPVPTCESCHQESADGHVAVHDASADLSPGCSNCHATNLVDEHVARGYGCPDCHMDDDHAAAIDSGLTYCEACHESPVHRQRPGR